MDDMGSLGFSLFARWNNAKRCLDEMNHGDVYSQVEDLADKIKHIFFGG